MPTHAATFSPAFFETSPFGFFIADPQGRLLFANAALAKMLGYAVPEELARSAAGLAEQVFADPEKRGEYVRLMQEQGKVVDYQCRCRRGDGTEFWASLCVQAVFDGQGNVSQFQGVMTDMSASRQAEEALRRSEERCRNVGEANAGIIWEMDANLIVTHVSGRVREILGHEPEEVVGQNPLFFVDAEDRERVSAILAQMRHEQRNLKDFKCWCRHRDGRRVRIQTNSVAYFARDGALLGFRGTHIDVTESYWSHRCQEIILLLHEMSCGNDAAISAMLCEACSELTDSSMAFFGMVEPDESAMIAHVWSPKAMEECAVSEKPMRFPIETAGLWAQPIRLRKPMICNDYAGADGKQGLPEGHVRITRYLGVPILHGEKVIAVAGAANRASGYEERHINRLRVITSTIADILLLHRKEHALQESESLLARSQSIAGLGSWKLDLIANRLTWTDEVYRIFGLAPGESSVSYEVFLDCVHPEDRSAVHAAYSRSVREGRNNYELVHRIIRRDTREVRHVHQRCVHERDETGKIIRSIG